LYAGFCFELLGIGNDMPLSLLYYHYDPKNFPSEIAYRIAIKHREPDSD
jgi:hypothetical protein